ncbi:glutaredoxin family protein [Nakamurella endophytica]|uniref:Thioredoxin family protein n=1 Tax=Nakamurella endophytica TaxID=1748367 RepID=A0A917SYS5_9ACTN|nr:glutaredoxin family protein [Nakamurella endophytica]GGM04075.1 thioredoxin family protein [Nakamurella endophytica]
MQSTDGGVRIELLGRAGCHLCEAARQVVEQVAARTGAGWRELDVDLDPELRAEWGDMVPVVLVDGVCQGYFHIDGDRLAEAVAGRR